MLEQSALHDGTACIFQHVLLTGRGGKAAAACDWLLVEWLGHVVSHNLLG